MSNIYLFMYYTFYLCIDFFFLICKFNDFWKWEWKECWLNMRGLRSARPRNRPLDMHMESKSGTPSKDDEKSKASWIARNGNYRPLKRTMKNSLEDWDQSADKSRDAWQYGIQKKQSSARVVANRDS